jgi:hypothetical protein
LSKIEPNLADIASKSKPKMDDNTKKRKANDDTSTDIQVPKKKSAKALDQRSSDASISQREEKAMQNLIKFITENGGKNITRQLWTDTSSISTPHHCISHL